MPLLESLHPLVVHFLIACFFLVSFFLVLSLDAVDAAKGFGSSALLLLAIGTLTALLTIETGQEAARTAWRQMESKALGIFRSHGYWP